MGNALGILATKGKLSVPNAALGWGLHKYTVMEFIQKGLIASVRIGNRETVFEPEFYRIQGLLEKHGSLAKAYKATTTEGIEDDDST